MPTSKEINALSRKVSELNQSVHALTRGKSAGNARKAAMPTAADDSPVF
jgi:hypothetical protein